MEEFGARGVVSGAKEGQRGWRMVHGGDGMWSSLQCVGRTLQGEDSAWRRQRLEQTVLGTLCGAWGTGRMVQGEGSAWGGQCKGRMVHGCCKGSPLQCKGKTVCGKGIAWKGWSTERIVHGKDGAQRRHAV